MPVSKKDQEEVAKLLQEALFDIRGLVRIKTRTTLKILKAEKGMIAWFRPSDDLYCLVPGDGPRERPRGRGWKTTLVHILAHHTRTVVLEEP